MSGHLSSNDLSLLAVQPNYLELDRVKWTAPPRTQSNGKSFHNEVSVTMTGVNEERVCASYGLSAINNKETFGQESDSLLVRLNDFVLVRSPEGRQPFVARVVEMWETEAGSKEMKCQWFYRPAECQHESLGVDAGREFMRLHPQEVFLTIHDDPNPISTIVSGCVVLFCNEHKLWRDWSKKIPSDRLFFYARQFFPENGTFFNILRGHIQEPLPLSVINPQTFSSDEGREAKGVAKAQHPRCPVPASLSAEVVLPPPRKSIIDQYSESSDKNSDPDATLNVVHQHAVVGEAAKDHSVPKQRRQQKRLESDKVAKKPKPCPKNSQAMTLAPSLPGGADDEQVAAEFPVKEESKDEKKSCFTGEVLYNGENRRFYGQATLAGFSENISTGDVCWLMSDNPERPYIGRIIAMWQDEAGLCWTRVRWFYRKEDTSALKSKVVPVVGIDALSDAEIADKEVFASLAEDDNLLSTVDGVARLFKGDDVADWNAFRCDPNSVFVRRMYNASTAKFASLDKKWDALPEPRDLVFQ